ncbi:ubiquitin-protein transferase [Aureococcus anophagefferens]|nr:ubiquitin-protein transferase [Aureococcus anophagefferens]
MLLNKGADIDSSQDGKPTPLFLAIEKGHVAVVETLLNEGADVDASDGVMPTPLFYAAGRGHVAVVKTLLAHGALPTWGEATALGVATTEENYNLLLSRDTSKPRELEPESAPEPEPSPDEAFEETKGAELDPTAMRAVSEASAKKLVVQDVFDDIARHQAVVEAELADHRAELERLRIRRDEVPDFACPITTELMKDPVFAADGHTYERCAIALWFERKNTSPVTNAPLRNADLIPNHAMKSMIAEFLEQSRALVEA